MTKVRFNSVQYNIRDLDVKICVTERNQLIVDTWLIVCGECGETYRRHQQYNPYKKYYIWVCKRHENTGKINCSAKPIKEKALESAFLRALNGLIENSDEILEQIRAVAESEISDTCNDAVAEIEGEMDRCQDELMELLSKRETGQITENDYDSMGNRCKIKMDELMLQKQTVLTEQSKMQHAKYRIEAVTELLTSGKILQEFDKGIFKSLVRKIKVLSEKEIEIEFECGIKVKESVK